MKGSKWFALILTAVLLGVSTGVLACAQSEATPPESTEAAETLPPAQERESPAEQEEPDETQTPDEPATPAPTEEPTGTEAPTPESTETAEPAETAEPDETKEPDAEETPAPTESPEATDTPVPTETPTATSTPVPTETPTATSTPVPTESPVPTETPAPAVPRSVGISVASDTDPLQIGSRITLTAELSGYDGLDYVCCWQAAAARSDGSIVGEWRNVQNGGQTFTYVLTEENLLTAWRVCVSVNE